MPNNRLKLIVRPDRVNQVGVHYIHSGLPGKLMEHTYIRVVHYKRANAGVYGANVTNEHDIVRDENSLADSDLREKVYTQIQRNKNLV
jgi:hypothetical protein